MPENITLPLAVGQRLQCMWLATLPWCVDGFGQAAKAILNSEDDTISFLLGGITVGTAVVGTLGGGELVPSFHAAPSRHFKRWPLSMPLRSCTRAST